MSLHAHAVFEARRQQGRRLRRAVTGDRAYRAVLTAGGVLFVAVLAALVVTVLLQAGPALSRFGPGFVTSHVWDPVHAVYGALPFIVGTLITSLVALVLALPVGLGTAIFLAELAPRWMRGTLSTLVELLAAIPSVVYGLWGLLVVAPWASAALEPALKRLTGGSFPLFSGPTLGLGMLLAGMILAAMILPTIAAISRDVLAAVPGERREAAYALGATRWQMIRTAMLPPSASGLLGATTLALGRAMGETMAVTMVIGNRAGISASLFAPANTIASVIANEFTEATEPFHKSSLLALAAILLVMSVLVNVVARLLVWSAGRERLGAELV